MTEASPPATPRRRPLSSLTSISFIPQKLSQNFSFSVGEKRKRSPTLITMPRTCDDGGLQTKGRKCRTPPTLSKVAGLRTFDVPNELPLSLQGDTPRDEEGSGADQSSTSSSSSEWSELPVSKLCISTGDIEASRTGQRRTSADSQSNFWNSPRGSPLRFTLSNIYTKAKITSSEFLGQEEKSEHSDLKRVQMTLSSPRASKKLRWKIEQLPNSSDEEGFCAMVTTWSAEYRKSTPAQKKRSKGSCKKQFHFCPKIRGKIPSI